MTQPPRERAILVGVDLDERTAWTLADSLAELAQLARSAGVEVVGQVTQRLESPHPKTYLGKGKVQELANLREEIPYDLVIFDEELSPSQQRNLEDALTVLVMDRTALILDIFAQRARTHEGCLQVELAQDEYYLPRLTRLWTHLSRQTRGGVGLRGPGETQLETDRRRIRKRISDLHKELEEVRTHRALHRQHRRAEMIPVVALVGYTNAGKSTLLNALTGANVLVEDKLFATLDPTTRRVKLPNGQEVLFSDTVGFIQKLPTQLVAAFRATLEELGEADLLIHIIDITHPNAAEQAEAVNKTLAELGLSDKPMLIALNKIDRLVVASMESEGAEERRSGGVEGVDVPQSKIQNPKSELLDAIRQVAAPYPNAVAISAAQGVGLDDLLARVGETLSRGYIDITICLPYDQAELAAWLHKQGIVLEEGYSKAGVRMRVRVARRFQATLRPFVVGG